MIIGIDPGFSGAIAFLSKNSDSSVSVVDMPTMRQGSKKQVDAHSLASLIRPHIQIIKAVAIEDVHSMPNDGAVSAFSFGYSAGIIKGVCAGLNLPKPLMIPPNVWKPYLNLSPDKRKSLLLAKKLFPRYTRYFERAKDDGRAEAILIAYFARKYL